MLGPNPPRQLASGIKLRTAHPPHRVLHPDTLVHQILPPASQLAGDARYSCFGPKTRPAAQILDQHLPVHFLQSRLGLPPLQPAPTTVQLIPNAAQGPSAQSSGFTHRQITVHQTIPSLHALFLSVLLKPSLPAWLQLTSAFC